MTIQVLGVGFGRTGTMSVRGALIRLGFGPCYHMLEVAERGDAPFWARAAAGEAVDWDAVFREFRATVDWPAASYWRELIAHYPEARVLLTVRDEQSWFDSMVRTIWSPGAMAYLDSPDCPADARAMKRRYVQGTFGDRYLDREHAIAVYRRHNDEVRDVVPRDRLLVFDTKEGWEPLCAFLGVPVPDEPFPHLNNPAQWAEMFGPGRRKREHVDGG